MRTYIHASILIAVFMLCLVPGILENRSIHRIQDPQVTEVHARWLDDKDTKEYVLKSDTCEHSAIFDVFDHDHFMSHLLPQGDISFRSEPKKSVPGATLHKQLMAFLDEIAKAHEIKNEYTHFKILKKLNYNAKTGVGLIIMKFKEYPFVVKLYRETPETFTHPRQHDFQQRCLFSMGGGISRFLIGFTRLLNLNYILERIAQHPHWSKILDAPRKWFWLPDNARWFEATCEHINGTTQQRTVLPSTYAIIADAIEAEHVFEMKSREDRHLVLSLTNWLGGALDPNIPNYMREKKTGKVVFIDTEHFPTDLGLRKPMINDTYFSWYRQLAKKFINDTYFRSKRERLALRNGTYPCIMPCHEHAEKCALPRATTARP